jgi:hypothetical protein
MLVVFEWPTQEEKRTAMKAWTTLGLLIALLAPMLLGGTTVRAVATTSYTLTILKIECVNRQDPYPDMKDEIRLQFDAMPIYSDDKYTDGEVRNIKNVPVPFDSGIKDFDFWLYEEDNLADYDDLIGKTNIVVANVIYQGNQTVTIGTTNGKYKITYMIAK